MTTDKPNNPKDKMGASKPNISLVPPAGIIHAALCMQDGAEKYGPYNWREPDKKIGYMTYISAMQRHILQFMDGEDCAKDSGHSHLGHIISGCMVLLDAIECDNAIDDRPVKGESANLIDSHTKRQ